MSNVSFTRDEVILTLDVLYFSGEKRLSPRSEAIVELSALLNRLPITPKRNKPEIFRNCSGVCNQINSFRRSITTGVRNPNVGAMFYKIAFEFESNLDEIHVIANAIRRNVPHYDVPFGNDIEANGFPEGALLSHLHRVIEARDGDRLPKDDRCGVCQIEIEDIYRSCANFLMNHLTVPITLLDGGRRYGASDHITVCPNCHAALHRHRPWLTKENCGELLR